MEGEGEVEGEPLPRSNLKSSALDGRKEEEEGERERKLRRLRAGQGSRGKATGSDDVSPAPTDVSARGRAAAPCARPLGGEPKEREALEADWSAGG